MGSWEQVLLCLTAAQHEVMLFAAAGLILGGLDDLLIDLIYFTHRIWRDLFVYSRHRRMTTDRLPPPLRPGRIAIFIPAWQEETIIATTLRGMLARWQGCDFTLFVGTYPNDPATALRVATVAETDSRVQLVVHDRDGPTTKADCLNRLWRAMLRDEAVRSCRYKAIVLHDAEDVVHADELRLFDVMIERFDMVQLPVRPILNPNSPWIAGHYADEFAEAHGKYLCMRERVGASVPSAGVGCAFRREILTALAAERRGIAFDPSSLTEDYEIGLKIAERGGQSAFIRMRDQHGELVCTQEYFPDTLATAVRQKSRWLAGITLSGWDRMGWNGSIRECWARLHDRRSCLSVWVLLAIYLTPILHGLRHLIGLISGIKVMPFSGAALLGALAITSALMLWRLLIRALFTARCYGWRQGLMAIPRMFIANFIALLAARRALAIYLRQLRSGTVVWDKTHHIAPPAADEAT